MNLSKANVCFFHKSIWWELSDQSIPRKTIFFSRTHMHDNRHHRGKKAGLAVRTAYVRTACSEICNKKKNYSIFHFKKNSNKSTLMVMLLSYMRTMRSASNSLTGFHINHQYSFRSPIKSHIRINRNRRTHTHTRARQMFNMMCRHVPTMYQEKQQKRQQQPHKKKTSEKLRELTWIWLHGIIHIHTTLGPAIIIASHKI